MGETAKLRLVDRFHDLQDGHLYDAISHARNAQRAFPTIGLRDHHPTPRSWTVRFGAKFLSQLPQVPARVGSEVLDGLPVTPRCPGVRLHAFPRAPEVPFCRDFIVQ